MLETIVDIYEDDSAKNNITADSLEPAARKKVCHAFKRDIQRIQANKRRIGRICHVMPGANRLLPVMIRIPNFFHQGKKKNSRVNWEINNCNLDLVWEKEKMQLR